MSESLQRCQANTSNFVVFNARPLIQLEILQILQLNERRVFSIGTVAAYSAKHSALVAYKILELFQY